MDDLELLAEACDTLARGRELESVGVVLAFHPAGADAERDAAAGDLVRGCRVAREDGGMAERHRRDERPELQVRRSRGQPGDRGPGVEHRSALVGGGHVVVGAEHGLDAVRLARFREGDPVVPRHAFLALDHQREPHGTRP